MLLYKIHIHTIRHLYFWWWEKVDSLQGNNIRTTILILQQQWSAQEKYRRQVEKFEIIPKQKLLREINTTHSSSPATQTEQCKLLCFVSSYIFYTAFFFFFCSVCLCFCHYIFYLLRDLSKLHIFLIPAVFFSVYFDISNNMREQMVQKKKTHARHIYFPYVSILTPCMTWLLLLCVWCCMCTVCYTNIAQNCYLQHNYVFISCLKREIERGKN